MDEGELRDRFEIRELMERYSHTVDFMNWGQLESVFSADATIDYSALAEYFGDRPYRAQGLTEIRNLFEIIIPPTYGTLHYMTNHLIAVHADEARVCTYMHVGGTQDFGGIYLVGAVRTDAGWRIRDYTWLPHTRAEPADADRVCAWMHPPSR